MFPRQPESAGMPIAADMIRRSASDGKPGPDRIFPNLDSAVTWASTSPVSSVPRAEEE